MNQNVLNIITKLLCYSDPVVTDNPSIRNYDLTRNITSIPVKLPKSETFVLAPSESKTLFNGVVSSSLSVSSVIDNKLISPENSIYRLSVTSGPAGFRTARSVSGIDEVNITINNNTLAKFDFVGATLTGVQVGDIMRISGHILYDAGPFVFNPLNSGLWVVIGISGTVVTVQRMSGESFYGVTESILPGSGAASQVLFYSSDGVQKGNKFKVTGTLVSTSHKTYEVLDVTPSWIDFVSTSPIAEEVGLSYVPGTIIFYSASKKLIYIESDQNCVVRFNDDTSDNCIVEPVNNISACYSDFGYLHKWGETYKCVVVNKSVMPLNLKFISAE